MNTFSCPSCARVGSSQRVIPPGTRVKCPCGHAFRTADTDPYDIAPTPPATDPTSQAPPINHHTDPAPREPWFYRWVDGSGSVIFFVGMLPFCLSSAIALVITILGIKAEVGTSAVTIAVMWVLPSLALFILTTALGLGLRVFVDLVRKVAR